MHACEKEEENENKRVIRPYNENIIMIRDRDVSRTFLVGVLPGVSMAGRENAQNVHEPNCSRACDRRDCRKVTVFLREFIFLSFLFFCYLYIMCMIINIKDIINSC